MVKVDNKQQPVVTGNPELQSRQRRRERMTIPPCVLAFISEPGALQPMSGPHSASLGENVFVSTSC